MPGLLFPAALAALAALVLPLLLHIARRSEQRITDFAALRWLRERPRPRRRIRFDEWLLLALRLALIAMLALWLARPVLYGSADRTPWLVVMPGVDPVVAREAIRGRTRARWLAPGFPPLDRPAPADAASFPSLLRELDAALPAGAPLRVVVPAILQGADGERPRLSRRVEWRIVPGAMPPRAPGSSGPADIAVRATGGATGLGFLRAAVAALAPGHVDVAPVEAPLPRAGGLIWLGAGPLPAAARAWIEGGGTALLSHDAVDGAPGASAVWRDEAGVALVEGAALGRGRLLRFTRALTPAAMPALLEPDFPAHLRALFAAPAPRPERVRARDYAPVVGGASPERPIRDLRPSLAIFAALLLLAERWLATRRARAIAP